ncbi:alpha/beta hydrolase family esterase [Aestuariivita boseongensis]|uniref:alpha/beta hydrolase family esterase n=1 Tax=Aestuariivita boseongensis TaxID=1470562 RepID=UPI00067FFDBA|nr:PHB depolymerase family esterase [Aestuariivita boseongensis]
MRVLACLAALCIGSAVQAGCADAPDPCEVASGSYHIALPQTPRNAPVALFLHGAFSHGGNVMRNTALIRAFQDRGYAVLAPTALPRSPDAQGGVWNFYPGWPGRDEPAFLQDTLDDAATRFGVSPTRVLLTGFSAGAFMVSYLACDEPDSFPAYAPLAGAFWEPLPKTCKGPVKLHQTHGWRDQTVPIEGRPLRNGQWIQGDVFASLQIWRRANDCPNMSPDLFETKGDFMQRSWTDCARDSALEFALHPGGHMIPPGWVDLVVDWFEAQVP